MPSKNATQQNQNQKRTGFHDIDPRLMGLVIGRGGETIKGIARQAGNGCRINRTDKPGRFELTAWDSNAIQRAKMAIDQLIRDFQTQNKTNYQTKQTKTQNKQTKQTKQTKTQVGKTSVAAAFGSDSDSEGEEEQAPEQRPETKLDANARKANARKAKEAADLTHLVKFNHGQDSIRARKQTNWQEGQAYRSKLAEVQEDWDRLHPADKAKHGFWENYKYQKMGEYNRQCDKTKREAALKNLKPTKGKTFQAQLDASDFPQQLAPSSEPKLGAWGNSKALEGVRQEEAVVKPKEPKKPAMPVLKRSMTSQVTPDEQDKDKEAGQGKDEKLLAKLPKGPGKRFKSKTIVMDPNALQRPKLTRAMTVEQPVADGAWSDDDVADSWDTSVYA